MLTEDSAEDFLVYCKQRNLDPEDPFVLETFRNFIIDHGGEWEEE